MKLYRNLLLALLVLSAFSVNAENQSNSEAEADGRHDRDWDRDHDRDWDRDHDDCDRHDECKLKGRYAYELSGFVGPSSANLALNEAGALTFDGKGSGSGFGVSVLTGFGRINATYAFTYVEISEGVFEATGSRTSVNGVSQIKFVVATGDCCEHISLIVLPNATPVTAPPVQTLFNFVQVSGTGGK